MSAFDSQTPTQFGSVIFPRSMRTLHLVGRHHTHEYPHSPGGAPEKLGRGLYNVTIQAPFHDKFPRYPGLYPQGLAQMKQYAETQETQTLIDAPNGSYPCFIVDYKQVWIAKSRSGETLEVEFLEDQQTLFLVGAIAQSAQVSIKTSADAFTSTLAAIKAQLQLRNGSQSIFDSIQNTANAVFAIKDTVGLYGNLLAAKVDQLTQLCARADSLGEIQTPRAWPLVDALHNLWFQCVQLAKDLARTQVQLLSYVVPSTGPIQTIALNLYGDATKTTDILTLNAGTIGENALKVPAGTQLRYYPAPSRSVVNV
jgi:hypothetical protein